MVSNKRIFTLVCVASLLLFTVFPGSGYSQETIKIGVPIPLTGNWADEGLEMRRGVELVVDEANAKGGLFGKKIEMIVGDVGDFSAEKIVSVGEKLVNKDKVVALITGFLGGVVDIKSYGEFEVPYLHNDTSQVASDLLRDNPGKYRNCFQGCSEETNYAPGTVDFVTRVFPKATGYKFPNKKIALITMVRAYNDRISANFREIVKKSDWQIVVDEKTPTGTVEWGAILAKIRQEKPAFTYLNDHVPTDGVAFMDQFHQNPINTIIFIQLAPGNPSFINMSKGKANGVYWGDQFSASGPIGDAVDAKYRAKYKNPLSSLATVTYSNTNLWLEAAKMAGDPRNYKEIYRILREYSWNFVGQTTVYHPQTQTAIFGEGLNALLIHQVQDMKNLMVAPLRVAKTKMQVPPWIK